MSVWRKRIFIVDPAGNVFPEWRPSAKMAKAVVLSALGGMLQSQPLLIPFAKRTWVVNYLKPLAPMALFFAAVDPLSTDMLATATFVETDRTVVVDGIEAVVFDLQL